MNNRIDAVCARQSIDKKDSISIESQIESCKYELRGGSYQEYTDKGYSGKNTDRPDFQRLLSDIEAGQIAKVVVYKLDRISRSILDFARLMELFQKYNVEFVSSTEKFDTSTPIGRAMLNICIVFAQLERKSIQQRVVQAQRVAGDVDTLPHRTAGKQYAVAALFEAFNLTDAAFVQAEHRERYAAIFQRCVDKPHHVVACKQDGGVAVRCGYHPLNPIGDRVYVCLVARVGKRNVFADKQQHVLIVARTK